MDSSVEVQMPDPGHGVERGVEPGEQGPHPPGPRLHTLLQVVPAPTVVSVTNVECRKTLKCKKCYSLGEVKRYPDEESEAVACDARQLSVPGAGAAVI